MSNGIGKNPLTDISKVYLDYVSEKKKDDSYLETDMKKRQANNEKARKDMEKMGTKMKNPHFESVEKSGWDAINSLADAYKSVYKEAVKGQDSEMRKAASAERKSGDKRLSPSAGKGYADQQKQSISYMDKKTKNNKIVVGMTHEGVEVEEEKKPLPKTKMFRKAGNLGRDAISTPIDPEKRQKAYDRSKKIIKTLNQNEEVEVDEAMSSYDRNRKRAAQRAAERNAARAAGKTGVVPGVGYVSPRKERETYVDSAGTTRHKSGAKMEGLDPVGKEDGDVNNDGKKDSTDSYLMKRRKAIGNAMKKKMKEHRELAEESLTEVMTDEMDDKPIKEKKVKNKITINPKLGEAVEEMGGTLIEEIEVDEFDVIVETVYEELIEEGFSEDEVEHGIETALNTLDEGYYDSAVAASKAAAAKNKGETPKKSMKDRLKSAAKRAIMGVSKAAGKAVRAKAAVQAAPGKAKAKVTSMADRVKRIAKAGYASGRGPVEKKSKTTSYRGAGVGRKEKIGEESVVENVATGKAKRAKRGGIAQKVGASEVVSNKEKDAAYAKKKASDMASDAAAGDAAHKAATDKGMSPAEAMMRKKAAERKAARERARMMK